MSSRNLRLVAFITSIVAFQSYFGLTYADEPSKTKSILSDAVKPKWEPLVGSWETIRFGGEGEVGIEKNRIEIGSGDPMTGVRWKGEVLKENYEIELEAQRKDGFDFFCGLTFPIGDAHASFICGGWGGGVVGLSSIKDIDASSNETSQFKQFENGKWYKIRVRVTTKKVECFIDDAEMVSVEREDRLFSTRFEMDSSTPLGMAAYQCVAEYRNIQFRKLVGDSSSEAVKAVSIDHDDTHQSASPESSK